MTRKTKETMLKLFENDNDILRALLQELVQEILEAEMDELLGAGKHERTNGRKGYRSGYYDRLARHPSR